MNSSISRTWVQEASLLSRTPSAADMERPRGPDCPSNPASSTIFPESPLCASMMKESAGACSRARSRPALEGRLALRLGAADGGVVSPWGDRRFVARSSMNLTYRDDIKG